VTAGGRTRERPGGTPVYAAAALRAAGAEPVLVVKGARLDGAVVLPWHAATVSEIDHTAGETRQRLAAIGDGFTAPELAAVVPDLAGCRWVLLGGQSAGDFPPDGLAALAAAGLLLCVDGQGLCRGTQPGRVRLRRFAAEAVAGAAAVKLNRAEAGAQEADGPALRARLGVPELVVSEGAAGATVLTPEWSDRLAGSGEPFSDPTGAGDSLTALYLLERTKTRPPRQALRAAVEGVERLYQAAARS
jgi:sugar/nucleoside kinase (ribokinase family)